LSSYYTIRQFQRGGGDNSLPPRNMFELWQSENTEKVW